MQLIGFLEVAFFSSYSFLYSQLMPASSTKSEFFCQTVAAKLPPTQLIYANSAPSP